MEDILKKKNELTPGSKNFEFQSKPKKKALLQSSEVSSSYLLQSSEERWTFSSFISCPYPFVSLTHALTDLTLKRPKRHCG